MGTDTTLIMSLDIHTPYYTKKNTCGILHGTYISCILGAMIFNPEHQKTIRIIWAVVAVLVMLSMTLLYTPIFQ